MKYDPSYTPIPRRAYQHRRQLIHSAAVTRSTWKDGSPPVPGWYIATATLRLDLLRWWDGERWSHFVGVHCNDPAHAASIATIPFGGTATDIYWLPQEWIPRLWEGAVLP